MAIHIVQQFFSLFFCPGQSRCSVDSWRDCKFLGPSWTWADNEFYLTWQHRYGNHELGSSLLLTYIASQSETESGKIWSVTPLSFYKHLEEIPQIQDQLKFPKS